MPIIIAVGVAALVLAIVCGAGFVLRWKRDKETSTPKRTRHQPRGQTRGRGKQGGKSKPKAASKRPFKPHTVQNPAFADAAVQRVEYVPIAEAVQGQPLYQQTVARDGAVLYVVLDAPVQNVQLYERVAVASIAAEYIPVAEATAGQPVYQQSVTDDGVVEYVVMDAPVANTQLYERVATNQDDGDDGASTQPLYVHPQPAPLSDSRCCPACAVPMTADLLWIS